MSDTSLLAKTIVFIGTVLLFANLLYGGTSTAWTDLQNTLEAGPAVPSNQPYALQVGTTGMTVVRNGTWGLRSQDYQFGHPSTVPAISTSGTNGTCGDGAHVTGGIAYPGEYWDCLNIDDGPGSLVSLPGLTYTDGSGIWHEGYMFSVLLSNITGTDLRQKVLNVSVQSTCNIQTTPVTGKMATYTLFLVETDPVLGGWQNPGTNPAVALFPVAGECGYGGLPGPYGSDFYDLTNYASFQVGLGLSAVTLANISGAELIFVVDTAISYRYQISYVSITVNYLKEKTVSSPPCGDWVPGVVPDVACVLGNFFAWLSDVLTFVVGQIQVFLAYGVWFLQIMAGLFIGTILSLAWFFSIPGAPAPVQAVVDVVVLGILAIMLFLFVKIIRGTGTVG